MLHKVVAVVPDSCELMPGTAEIIVIVVHEDQPGIQAFLHDRRELLGCIGIRGELRVGIAHGELVVFADALHIRI